ncbi:hypothetical protein NLG97_g7519 [Lecanicillium saksenae]|uniref:Uncharacterized protein n=1 Tax=Lecanicillium saksenae TaxID=468837 RepID=A0ACC1QM60_9HYPO|nr:hypothetical protein NLG97_g7519 [Lecanicillium saksenae]
MKKDAVRPRVVGGEWQSVRNRRAKREERGATTEKIDSYSASNATGTRKRKIQMTGRCGSTELPSAKRGCDEVAKSRSVRWGLGRRPYSVPETSGGAGRRRAQFLEGREAASGSGRRQTPGGESRMPGFGDQM